MFTFLSLFLALVSGGDEKIHKQNPQKVPEQSWD